jgi:hypothetical protein
MYSFMADGCWHASLSYVLVLVVILFLIWHLFYFRLLPPRLCGVAEAKETCCKWQMVSYSSRFVYTLCP